MNKSRVEINVLLKVGVRDYYQFVGVGAAESGTKYGTVFNYTFIGECVASSPFS